jgi:PTS system cellobiose-specific IIB component
MPAPDPIRVLMLCAVGCSTTLLQSSIMKAAKTAGLTLELYGDTIDGFAYRDFVKDPFDVILIAPQVRIARKSIVRKAEPFGITVVLMDPMAFGMADGDKLLRQILDALQTP